MMYINVAQHVGGNRILVLADGASLDVEARETEHFLLEYGEVLVRQLTHKDLLRKSRIAGILVAVLDVFHPAVELLTADVQRLAEVQRVQMVFRLVHHHHDVVGRLVIHQQLAVTVGDDASRRIFYLLQEGIRVGTLLVVVARNLQLKQTDDVYHHDEDGDTSDDIVPVTRTVFLHLLSAFEDLEGVDKNQCDGSAAYHAEQPLQPVEEIEEFQRVEHDAVEQANKRDEVYIFNDKTNGGYVIVSGDERVPSILGYSERGEIDNNIPDNMRAWLQEYANQIDYLKKHSSVNTRTAAIIGPAISPLLGETSWGQQDPFNLFCPEYEGKRTITGCVSTAMAQIMNYYSWPDATTKEIPGYKTETLELPVSSIPVSSIDWNNMLPSYNSGSETQIQKEAVARLMLMCGTALNMDYRLDGSSSSLDNVSFALKEYFDYAKNLKVIRQGNYSLNSWNQIIYKELAAGRPVCCSGENADEEGHAFVVDGYDKDDYFHVNWGWYGLNNGYFLLSLLDPNMIGEGYNRYQVGIIGIKRSIDMNPEGYNDGDLIVAKTVEGVDMTFEIISAEDMTCEVRGNGCP